MSGQSLKNTEDKSRQVIIALREQLDEANDEKVLYLQTKNGSEIIKQLSFQWWYVFLYRARQKMKVDN